MKKKKSSLNRDLLEVNGNLLEISIEEFERKKEEDELKSLDLIREEEIKEFFKSSEPRNFIKKIKTLYSDAI
jgi:hypothetical protein